MTNFRGEINGKINHVRTVMTDLDGKDTIVSSLQVDSHVGFNYADVFTAEAAKVDSYGLGLDDHFAFNLNQ